jgi:hypothetical protein
MKRILRMLIFLIIMILLASSFGLSGCNEGGKATNPPTMPTDLPSQSPNPVTAPEDSEPVIVVDGSPPLYVDLSFPNGAPRLNQVAELLYAIRTPGSDNVTIVTDLPDGLVLVSGSLYQQLGSTSGGDIKELKITIKPIKTGEYVIKAKLYFIHWTKIPMVGPIDWIDGDVYLSVSENSSQWGRAPYWIPSGPVPIHRFE